MRLNELIACERFYGGVAPCIGEPHLRPVCITGYPAQTIPQMLGVLLRHPGLPTVSARFITLDPVDVQDQLKLERLFWVREAQGSIIDMVLRAMKVARRKTLNPTLRRRTAGGRSRRGDGEGGCGHAFRLVHHHGGGQGYRLGTRHRPRT